MEYINGAELPYMAVAFSDAEALKRYLKEHALTMLVTAQRMAGEMPEIPMLYLSAVHTDEENAVYRYQSGTRLVEQITVHFRSLVPDSRTQETWVYMVYSPIGRSGKTSLALELTRQLAGSLYIGMENFSSLESTGGTLGSLLYSVMQKDERVLDELNGIRVPYHGSFLVASPPAYYDLRVLDYEHLSWFLTQLCRSSEYSAIILDVDAGVFETMELLRCGGRLLVPVLHGDKENKKLQSMEQAMRAWGCRELYERMEFVALPDAQKEGAEFERCVKELLA